MSVIHTNSIISSSATQSTVAVSKALWLRLAQYRLYRKTLSEMKRMSTRELADFGLNRCDINRIAHECVYGR
ncbi:MAG: DUF1127 domain-containing protein [Rhodobacteraceae bacterium]|nr:DUF1127 domain-containing protein [Paracoccaceae bacterium]